MVLKQNGFYWTKTYVPFSCMFYDYLYVLHSSFLKICAHKLGKRKDLKVLLGFLLTIVFIRAIRLTNSPIKDCHEDNIKSL